MRSQSCCRFYMAKQMKAQLNKNDQLRTHDTRASCSRIISTAVAYLRLPNALASVPKTLLWIVDCNTHKIALKVLSQQQCHSKVFRFNQITKPRCILGGTCNFSSQQRELWKLCCKCFHVRSVNQLKHCLNLFSPRRFRCNPRLPHQYFYNSGVLTR